MKKILFVLSLTVAFTLVAAQNDMAEREKLTETLLENLGVRKQIVANFAKVKALHVKIVNKILENASKSEEVSKFREKVLAVSDNTMSWDALKKDFIKIYAGAYSVDDLNKLNSFFSSPTGKKFVSQTPILQRKLVSALQNHVKKANEKVREMAREFMKDQMLQGKTKMPPMPKKKTSHGQLIQL